MSRTQKATKLRYIYFLRANKITWILNKRVTGFHQFVFHGSGEYPGQEFGDDWVAPSATNQVRELLHISRSGAIVPDIFAPRGAALVISPAVRSAVKHLAGIQFHQVVFEHVVDLPMPKLGVQPAGKLLERAKSAYYAPIRRSEKEDPFRDELMRLPDLPQLREQFDDYVQLLPATLIERRDYTDAHRIGVSWGSYNSYSDGMETIRYSAEILDDYAITDIGGCVFALTDEAFAAIAPFLNLDYYDIAVHKIHVTPP